MKKYFSIFKLRYINSLQYRVSAIAGVVTQLCFGLMYIMLFSAFYKMGNVPDNFTYDQMITYLWLQQAFFSFFGLYAQNKDMIRQVVEGNISYELVRPMNLYNNWFFTFFSERLSKVTLRFLPILIVAFLVPKPYKMGLPASVGALFLFLLAFIVGGLLVVSLSMLCYAVLFRTMTPNGLFSLFSIIGTFLSGAAIPIPLMPQVLQKVVNFMPFRYTTDLAYRIYCGSIDIKSALIQLGIQLAWLVGTVIIGKLAFRRNLKRVEVQGG